MHATPLSPGYHPLPPGHLANVVTCLEMTEKPALRPWRGGLDLGLERLGGGSLDRYRRLFASVGRDNLWFSRLFLSDGQLAAIIGDARVQAFALTRDRDDIGLLELDFREAGTCELTFFGLVPPAIGAGLGRFLMNEALTRAWGQPIARLWVHTCSFDHPAALGFYLRSGFRPYKVMVEVHPDPRLTGHLPRDASPQAPLIEA